MATINPYLNFSGTAEEAFNFYKSVFGGEFLSYYGSLVDKFDIHWMVSFENNEN